MVTSKKQQRFIDLYVIPGTDGSLNATQAYRQAYPNCKSDAAAGAAAARLLGNVRVREEVDGRLAVLAAETHMTAKEAWGQVACIARSTIKNFLNVTGANPKTLPANQISDEAWKSLKSVKVKRYVEGTAEDGREVEIIEYTLWPKLEANVVVLKGHGELKEKVEHTGKDGQDLFQAVRIFLPDNGRSNLDDAANDGGQAAEAKAPDVPGPAQ
jgi:Terminase small subunit